MDEKNENKEYGMTEDLASEPEQVIPAEQMPSEEVAAEIPEQPQEAQEPAAEEAAAEEPAAEQEMYRGAGSGRVENVYEPVQSGSWNGGSADAFRQYQQPAYQPYQNPVVPPQEPVTLKKKRGGKVWKGVLAAVLAVVLVAGSCGITAVVMNNAWESKTAVNNQMMLDRINALQKQIEAGSHAATGESVSGSPVASVEGGLTPSQVYARNVGSVVAIANQGTTTNIYGQVSNTASSGSGFILSEDGYVVSNYHVVEGATTLTVITYDCTEYPATLIGYDAANDISLLKINATGLVPVKIGSSDDLIVGDQVAAIGNPLGELTATLTVGYVSAKDRTINTDGTLINMMQTDAAINPGNSGGPLFNMKGEVVGITTAKYSGSTGSGASIEGIGFAIPMDDVAEMISDLIEYGYVRDPAYLGVTVRTVDSTTAATYGLVVGSQVDEVVETGCAYKAGVRSKDIITDLGGYHITGNADLITSLRRFKAGQTTTITVYRNGQSLTFSITLDEKPRQAVTEVPQQQPEAEMPSGSYDDWFRFFFGGRD